MEDQESKYQMGIKKIYDNYLSKEIKDSDTLIHIAREIYNEICTYNRNFIDMHINGKDDVLIYYIACYLKKIDKYKSILSSYGIADLAYNISLGVKYFHY